METGGKHVPQAREAGLLCAEVPDGLVIYDTENHEAHGLNVTSAFIFRHCNGQRTVGELAALLPREVNLPPDEAVVWLALDQLRKARLLRDLPVLPEPRRYSRRQLVQKLGLAGAAALLMPLIDSMGAPVAAHHASHLPKGNNGVGNGLDPQPPGNPPINDGSGTSPGNPGNQGGTP